MGRHGRDDGHNYGGYSDGNYNSYMNGGGGGGEPSSSQNMYADVYGYNPAGGRGGANPAGPQPYNEYNQYGGNRGYGGGAGSEQSQWGDHGRHRSDYGSDPNVLSDKLLSDPTFYKAMQAANGAVSPDGMSIIEDSINGALRQNPYIDDTTLERTAMDDLTYAGDSNDAGLMAQALDMQAPAQPESAQVPNSDTTNPAVTQTGEPSSNQDGNPESSQPASPTDTPTPASTATPAPTDTPTPSSTEPPTSTDNSGSTDQTNSAATPTVAQQETAALSQLIQKYIPQSDTNLIAALNAESNTDPMLAYAAVAALQNWGSADPNAMKLLPGLADALNNGTNDFSAVSANTDIPTMLSDIAKYLQSQGDTGGLPYVQSVQSLYSTEQQIKQLVPDQNLQIALDTALLTDPGVGTAVSGIIQNMAKTPQGLTALEGLMQALQSESLSASSDPATVLNDAAQYLNGAGNDKTDGAQIQQWADYETAQNYIAAIGQSDPNLSGQLETVMQDPTLANSLIAVMKSMDATTLQSWASSLEGDSSITQNMSAQDFITEAIKVLQSSDPTDATKIQTVVNQAIQSSSGSGSSQAPTSTSASTSTPTVPSGNSHLQ